MTHFLIQKIGLKKRIYSGYIVTGTLALILAFLSWEAFNRLSADFQTIVVFSRNSTDNMALAARMSEMQRHALIYIYEGHDSAGDRVGVICKDMLRKIERNRELGYVGIDAVAALAKEHLHAYHTTFQEVRRHREIQKRLVRSEFRDHASRAQQLIEDLMAEPQQEDIAITPEYSRMLISLLQIEKNAYRYFDSLDAAFIDSATASIRETRTMIHSMQRRAGGGPQKLTEAAAVLDKYESSFLEAVQRTRGYLYLVNVVMAAQAYETGYQSKKLSAMMVSESKSIQQKILKHIRSRLNLLLLSTVLLLLFICLFSYVISRSITVPLNRLTKVFKTLTSGSAEAEIPVYTLQDELGDLTRAAESFKAKNIELKANKKELERSNDELEQFVYTVSHDLKSPIVTSMGFIGIIRKLAAQGKYEQAIVRLDKVVKANKRMSQLISDLLELSRVGRIDMDKKKLDLDELLGNFVRMQAERLAEEGFRLTIASDLPAVYANESRTLQVFENILSNALKYAHNDNEGNRLHISAAEDNDRWHIYCEDNGPGIPQEYHEKIFGLFYRLDSGTEGTGIGLAVAKKIMQFHNGDIRVEPQSDRVGNGAIFRVSFPKNDKV